MSGFQSPNYTQTPNDLFDTLLPDMGLAELKVVMCIVRHTFGYHKEMASLSLRAIARFTGLTANSVMEGAVQAEGHGLIVRHQDGNKTTIWEAVVSVVPTTTRRISRYDTSVSPTAPLLGVKEINKDKEKPKGDLLDAEIHFNLKPTSIRQAMKEYFKLNVNWETKTARQWMEWAVGENITPDQIARAADLWRRDKQFNWQVPSLKGIFEKWPMLTASSPVTPQTQYRSERLERSL